ncbi:MAG: tRNA lysidine(34) synthetase TilS [Prolixibacteraceae bacterium]
MYDRFFNFIKQEELFGPSDKLLLGVSGGVDSVVLARLTDRLGNQFALAHCNFNLRGTASDDDEKFVINLANELGVKCYLSSFQTANYASANGISIEMAARVLRYEWFEKIRVDNGFDWLLVGHHLDDVLETFILNLSRGTGIRGLSGIQSKAGKVLRPLLFASRTDIEKYAREMEYAWRHDASNDDVHFKRNKVRHKILPLFTELNPSFRQNLQRTIHYLDETKKVLLTRIAELRESLVTENDQWVRISIAGLKNLEPVSIYLYELLREYHFKTEVVEDMVLALDGNPGSCFYSPTHRLVIDREDLIVTAIEPNKTELFYIEKTDKFLSEPLHLRLSVERYTDDFKIPNSPFVVVFDYDLLRFPLVLRHWKIGEYFKPLGMQGLKKVSDFFIDEKYSIPEKEAAWILASEDKVAWIVGKRIDERFKITENTQLVLRIEIIEP